MTTFTNLAEFLKTLVIRTWADPVSHRSTTPFGRFRTTVGIRGVHIVHYTELGTTVAIKFPWGTSVIDLADDLDAIVVPACIRTGSSAISLPYAGKEVDHIIYTPKDHDPIEVEVTETGLADLLQIVSLWSQKESSKLQFFFHPLGAVYCQDGIWTVHDGKRTMPVASVAHPKPQPTVPAEEPPVSTIPTVTDAVWTRDELAKAIVRNFRHSPLRVNCGVAIVDFSPHRVIIRDVKNVELVSFAYPDGLNCVTDWIERNILPFTIKLLTARIEYSSGPHGYSVTRDFPLTENGFKDAAVWKGIAAETNATIASGILLSPFGSVGPVTAPKATEAKSSPSLGAVIKEACLKEATAERRTKEASPLPSMDSIRAEALAKQKAARVQKDQLSLGEDITKLIDQLAHTLNTYAELHPIYAEQLKRKLPALF